MIDKQINDELINLQKELSKLKSAIDYIDGTKDNAIKIVTELEGVQQNYSKFSEKIYKIAEQHIEDLKHNTEFLIKYDGIVESTIKLITILESIDFNKRFGSLENIVSETTNALSELHNSNSSNHEILLTHLAKHEKQSKSMRNLLFTICGISFASLAISAVLLYKFFLPL